MTCEHCIAFVQEKEAEVQEAAARGNVRAHAVMKMWQRFCEQPTYPNVLLMSAVVNAYLSHLRP